MTIRDLSNWRSDIMPSPRLLQDDMNRFFENFYSSFPMIRGSEFEKMPAVNIVEGEKSFRVDVELAGIPPESVDLSVSQGMLTVKGEKKEEKSEKQESYLCRESMYGSFYRQIPLPDAADGDKADASFVNGMLTVIIPKKAESSSRARKLEIKKAQEAKKNQKSEGNAK